MTVPSETSKVVYLGDDTTFEFPTVFGYWDPADVKVRAFNESGGSAVLVQGVDYELTGQVTPGGPGQVVFPEPPFLDQVLWIYREVPFTQETAFRTAGTFSPVVHERAFDESVYRDQELDRRLSALELGDVEGFEAGDGLELVASTLHVRPGAGITIASDEVTVAFQTVSPTTVGAGAGSVGAASLAARSDHTHQVSTAAPVAATVGAGGSAGAATTLARSDHQHAMAAGVPVAADKSANAEGAAVTFARSDHKHDIATGVPGEIWDGYNSEGVATTLARSDHTHAHGSRVGEDLHAVATPSVNGFMSAADKTKLDTLVAELVETAGVNTTDATPTVIWSKALGSNCTIIIDALVTARQKASEANNGAGYRFHATWKRDAGALVNVAETATVTHEDSAGWHVESMDSGTTLQLKVTGAAASTIRWEVIVRWVIAVAPV
jgi:hypothetical protein